MLVIAIVPAASADGEIDGPSIRPGARLSFDESEEEEGGKLIAWRDDDFISKRIAGDIPLDNQQAGALRAEAARAAARLRQEGIPTAGPSTFSGDWAEIGPKPIAEAHPQSGTARRDEWDESGHWRFARMAQWILGAAQGGIWVFDFDTNTVGAEDRRTRRRKHPISGNWGVGGCPLR